MKPTRLNDCQYLLISPINHPWTNFANHTKDMSHDAINRFLSQDQMTPRLVWDNVRDSITSCADGDVVFDDTIVDKDFLHRIELVRRQYSGNARGLIKGIGVVTCVYVNPHTAQYWVMRWSVQAGSCAGHARQCSARQVVAVSHGAHG